MLACHPYVCQLQKNDVVFLHTKHVYSQKKLFLQSFLALCVRQKNYRYETYI